MPRLKTGDSDHFGAVLALSFVTLLAGSVPARADQDTLDATLRHVARLGQLGEVQKTLAEGAQVDAMAPYGETALQYAALYGHTSVVRFLIQSGAQVNHADYEGNTPLIVAAHNCNPRTVAALLAARANPNSENHHGSTALTFATDQGCLATVRFLLAARGIQVNHKDDWDKSALDYARANAVDPGFYDPELLLRLQGSKPGPARKVQPAPTEPQLAPAIVRP